MQENIKKYRKKPVIIEAYKTDKKLVIHTLEGDMVASPGDYVITGVKGENTRANLIYLKRLMNLLKIDCYWNTCYSSYQTLL